MKDPEEASPYVSSHQQQDTFSTGGDTTIEAQYGEDSRWAEEHDMDYDHLPSSSRSSCESALECEPDSRLYVPLGCTKDVTTTTTTHDKIATDEDEQHSSVLINKNNRPVQNLCAICLESYQVLDIVACAYEGSSCPHVYHRDCLVAHLLRRKGKEPSCPTCRRDFLESTAFSSLTEVPTDRTKKDIASLGEAEEYDEEEGVEDHTTSSSIIGDDDGNSSIGS